MIYENGKPRGPGGGGLADADVRRLLESSNRELLEAIAGMIGHRLAALPAAGGGADDEDVETLRRLAKEMSGGSGVERSNFDRLGSRQTVEGDKEGDDSTVDMLSQLPEP